MLSSVQIARAISASARGKDRVAICRIAVVLLVGIHIAVAHAAHAEGREVVLVEQRHVSCFLENVESYLDSEDDPVIIFISLCPKVEPSTDEILDLASNASLIVIKESDEPVKAASVVVWTRQQIHCLNERSDDVICPASGGRIRLSAS